MIKSYWNGVTTFSQWRIKASDGFWHLVERYQFTYTENKNENSTFCGIYLVNPPFIDMGSSIYQSLYKEKEEPEPLCNKCIKEYYRSKRDDAIREAAFWGQELEKIT